MGKRQLRLCLLCSLVVAVVAGCRAGETLTPPASVTFTIYPTSPRPDILPTLGPLTGLGFTISDCLVERQLLPYLCGIVPGQATMDEVQERVGEPAMIHTRDDYCRIGTPRQERIDTCWSYPYPTNLGVAFGGEVVIDLIVGFSAYALTLGEAVEILGPPERVLLACELGSSPSGWEEGRANQAYFLWPEQGIHLFTALYGTQGVGLDEEVPLFPAELSISSMTAFEPCTLEELEKFRKRYVYDRWVGWPGMVDRVP